MDKLYKIKPLEWHELSNGTWRADTQPGHYTVESDHWRYFFGEYFLEGADYCTSIEEGKAATSPKPATPQRSLSEPTEGQ